MTATKRLSTARPTDNDSSDDDHDVGVGAADDHNIDDDDDGDGSRAKVIQQFTWSMQSTVTTLRIMEPLHFCPDSI